MACTPTPRSAPGYESTRSKRSIGDT